jgi:hypothetical protein
VDVREGATDNSPNDEKGNRDEPFWQSEIPHRSQTDCKEASAHQQTNHDAS